MSPKTPSQTPQVSNINQYEVAADLEDETVYNVNAFEIFGEGTTTTSEQPNDTSETKTPFGDEEK